MAKKAGLNIPVSLPLGELKKGIADSKKIISDGAKTMEKEAEKMSRALDKIGKNPSLIQASREARKLALSMEHAGLSGTKAFGDVIREAGRLQDRVGDVKGQIAAMAPGGAFVSLGKTLGSVAQGFAGVQGAMALFGAESENVQKTLLKVQAAMALAEGFKAIEGLKDGFQELGYVIKANPIMAIATVVAAAAVAFMVLNKEVDLNRELSIKAYESTVKEKTGIEVLRDTINSETASEGEKLRAKQALIDQFPEYYGNLSAATSETWKFNQAIASQIALLDIQARAQAAQEQYVAALKEQNKALQDLQAIKPEDWGKQQTIFDLIAGDKGSAQLISILDAADAKVAKLKTTYEQLNNAVLAAQSSTTKFGTPDKPKIPGAKTPKEDAGWLQHQKMSEGIKKADLHLQKYAGTAAYTTGILEGFGQVYIDNTESINKSKDAIDAHLESMSQIGISAEQIQAAFFDVANAIGAALVSGDNLLYAIGESILMSLGQFMQDLGKQAIIMSGLIQAFVLSLASLNPIQMAIVGGLLIAGGAAVKSLATKGLQPAKMAKGGIVPGGYPNDSFPAMLSSNEAVIPLDRRDDMFGGNFVIKNEITPRGLATIVMRGHKELARG